MWGGEVAGRSDPRWGILREIWRKGGTAIGGRIAGTPVAAPGDPAKTQDSAFQWP